MFQATEASTLGTILARFWPTFLVELAVLAFVAKTIRRNARPGRLGRRRLSGGPDTSGLWCLPFYVWVWQANRLLGETFSRPEDLTSMRRIYERTLVTIFVSLFYLLVLRTIATILTREAPATLGMTGPPRTAVTASLLCVFLHAAFFLRIMSEGVTRFGLPFPLR